MPSTIQQAATAKRMLIPAALLLLVLALLPNRFLGWTDALSGLAVRITAPASGPVKWLVGKATPEPSYELVPGEAEQLRDELERYERLYLQEVQKSKELQSLLDDFTNGVELDPTVAVFQYPAQVIGNSSDSGSTSLRIRAGSNVGVEVNTVATVRAVDLLGKVSRVGGSWCEVRPITDRGGEKIQGIVLGSDARGAAGPTCILHRVGDGTLFGDVADQRDASGKRYEVQIGDTVRLSDRTWPDSAQMLVIGTVIEVEPDPNQALRQNITVKPRVDLEHVSEVILRVPEEGGP